MLTTNNQNRHGTQASPYLDNRVSVLLVLREDPLLLLRPLEPLSLCDVAAAVPREEVVHAHREVALLRSGRPARPPPVDVLRARLTT